MRILVFKDTKIPQQDYDTLCRNYTNLMVKHAGITPIFITRDKDYTNVPTVIDADGDTMPTLPWRQQIADETKAIFGEYGIDHIIPLVHQDNWIFKGVWGTNWSNKYYTYHISLCRFDKKNPVNSLGTLYHETMHSFDALIYSSIGVNVQTYIPVLWDKFCVHGGRPDSEGTTEWKYIRYNENTKALEMIAGDLRKSYQKRKDLQLQQLTAKESSLRTQLISMIQAKIVNLRALLAQKNGVPKK